MLCIDSRLFGEKEDGQGSGKDLKIMFTVSDGSDTFRATLAEAAQNAAEEAGYTIDIQDAAGSSETQMNQIKNAKDADVIICALCDAGTAQQMEALAGDKPIVFINSCRKKNTCKKINMSMLDLTKRWPVIFRQNMSLINMRPRTP